MKGRFSIDFRSVAKRANRWGIYFIAGALVLVIGTLGVWQFRRLLSPSDLTTGNGATVQLSSSDHQQSPNECSAKTPLANSLTGNDTPCYSDTINSGPTAITPTGGNFSLFRIQGEVSYR